MQLSIDKDFPCKTCGHEAAWHYQSIVEKGCQDLCGNCLSRAFAIGETTQMKEQIAKESVHPFIPDNLKYLESKRGTK